MVPALPVNELQEWCEANCTGKFDAMLKKQVTKKGVYREWMFEYPEDATAFSLRWK